MGMQDQLLRMGAPTPVQHRGNVVVAGPLPITRSVKGDSGYLGRPGLDDGDPAGMNPHQFFDGLGMIGAYGQTGKPFTAIGNPQFVIPPLMQYPTPSQQLNNGPRSMNNGFLSRYGRWVNARGRAPASSQAGR